MNDRPFTSLLARLRYRPAVARQHIDRVLLDLGQPDGTSDPRALAAAWHGADAEAVRRAVARHRLNAAARDALRQAGGDVDPDLDLLVEDDRRVRLLAMRALGTVSQALDDAGVPWVLFKGPAISRLMARRELRTFNDLDLLVDAASFATAADVLVEAGVSELNENWAPYLRYRVGEVPMAMYGITIDLHWHLIGLGRDRTALRIDPDAMVQRRVERTIDDRVFPMLDPTDQLLQLVVHAALGGARRVDQFRDVAVVIAGEPIDWDRFVQRAHDAWVAGLVAHTLDRATRAGPAEVDDGIIGDLIDDRSLERRRRLDGPRIDGLRALPVMGRRRRRRDGALVLSRHLIERLAGPAHRGWDFTEPRSRLYHDRATGGPAGREAFFEAVSRSEI